MMRLHSEEPVPANNNTDVPTVSTISSDTAPSTSARLTVSERLRLLRQFSAEQLKVRKYKDTEDLTTPITRPNIETLMCDSTEASDESELVTQDEIEDSSSTSLYQCEDYSSENSNSAEAVKPSRSKAYRHYRESTRKVAEWRLRTREILLRDSYVGLPRPGDTTDPRFFYREPFFDVEKTYTSSSTQTPSPYNPSTSVDTEHASAPDMIQEPPVYPPPQVNVEQNSSAGDTTQEPRVPYPSAVNVEQSSSAGAAPMNRLENYSAGDTSQEPPVYPPPPVNVEQNSSAGDTTQEPRVPYPSPVNVEQSFSAGAAPMNRIESYSAGDTSQEPPVYPPPPVNVEQNSSAGDTTQEPRVPYPSPVNVEQNSSAGAAPMNRMENYSAGDTSQAPLTIHYRPEPEAGVASSSATDTTQALYIHYAPVYNAVSTIDAASNQAQLHTPATGQEGPSATQNMRPENQARNACTKSSRIICQDLKLFMQLRNRLLRSDAVEISTHDYELPHLNAQNAGDGLMMDEHSNVSVADSVAHPHSSQQGEHSKGPPSKTCEEADPDDKKASAERKALIKIKILDDNDRFNNFIKHFCNTHAAIKEEDKNEVIWSMRRTQAQWVPVLARMRASRIMEGLLEVVNDNCVAVKRARDRKARETRRRGAQTMYKSLTDDEIKHANWNSKNDYGSRPYRSA